MTFTSALKLSARIVRPIYQKVAGTEAALAEFPAALVRSVYGNYATLKVDDFRLKVNLNDVILAGQMLFLKEYEPVETLLLKKILAPGDTAVDVGANIGYFSVLMAKAVGHSGVVIAIEPDPNNASLLEHNLALNEVSSWVSIVHAAVSDEPGRGTLYRSSKNYGDHRMWRTAADEQRREKRTAVSVRITTLDDVMSSHRRIDCMKIDIQGFEPRALGGLSRKLGNREIATMLFECWPYGMRNAGFDPREFIALVWNSGFKTWRVMDGRLQPLLSLDFVDNIDGKGDISIFAANPSVAERQLSSCGLCDG